MPQIIPDAFEPVADMAQSLSQGNDILYTLVHVWAFYVLYACAVYIFTWVTRDRYSVTVDMLLGVQKLIMEQNMPNEEQRKFMDRYVEIQEGLQNLYAPHHFSTMNRILQARASARAHNTAQQLLADVKFSAINVSALSSERRSAFPGESRFGIRSWNIPGIRQPLALSDSNLAPFYRHHPDIQEGLEKDASEDKFSGEFWV